MKKLLISFYLFTTIYFAQTNTSFFNENWLKSTVSIEVRIKNDYRPIGTGFILKTFSNHFILVTAKHVIIDENDRIKENIYYRMNDVDTNSTMFETNYPPKLKVNKGWFFSDKYDIAVRFIYYHINKSELVVIDTSHYLSTKYLKPAANVLILGYPLGLRSEKYSTPIVRKGIVAKNENESIIVDGFVFPGNSGGPVLYSPPLKIGKGLETKMVNEEKLIGMVANYIPYQDIAVSKQTNRPRISFEENTGLCNVVPVEAILEIMTRPDFKNIDENMVKYR